MGRGRKINSVNFRQVSTNLVMLISPIVKGRLINKHLTEMFELLVVQENPCLKLTWQCSKYNKVYSVTIKPLQ